MAQRLVRTICPHCKTEQKVESDYLGASGFRSRKLERPNSGVAPGAKRCRQFGYQGRKGIYELLFRQ